MKGIKLIVMNPQGADTQLSSPPRLCRLFFSFFHSQSSSYCNFQPQQAAAFSSEALETRCPVFTLQQIAARQSHQPVNYHSEALSSYRGYFLQEVCGDQNQREDIGLTFIN